MNFGNSKIYDPQRLLLNLSDKINLKGSDKYVALSNLSIYDTWKNIKKLYPKIINLKHQLQGRMINLNYLTGQILDQIFKIILSISQKAWRKDY